MTEQTVIVLAMHGAPPRDFPRRQLGEFFALHSHRHHAGHTGDSDPSDNRYRELEKQIRNWPRTPENDPFHAASMEMAGALSRESGHAVIVGFNEFCAPDIDTALNEAAGTGASRVIVVTPMMTRGGEHAEKELPALIETACMRHPDVTFEYAWPFAMDDIARFLAAQITK